MAPSPAAIQALIVYAFNNGLSLAGFDEAAAAFSPSAYSSSSLSPSTSGSGKVRA
ncbi:MAG: hypothetical protein R2734_15585 [Nocardioides sp.]